MINFSLPDKKTFAQWRFRKNTKARKKLYGKLARMLENSVPIKDALTDLKKRRLSQFSQNDAQAQAFSDWVQRMGSGDNFSKALSGWVPSDEQNIISGGETSGRVSETLINLIGVLEAKTKIKSTLVKALSYPSVIFIGLCLILAVFGGFSIPMFLDAAPNIHLYGTGAFVASLTGFFYENLFLIFGFLLVIALVFKLSLNRWVDGFRVKVDHFGPWAIFSMLQGVSWLISFSSLIQAGVPVKDALKQTSLYANPWLKARINAITQRIGDFNLGEAMSRTGYNFPDKEVINDLATYSQYSGFDQALKSIADEWLIESLESIEATVKILNYTGLILGAAVIILLGLGMASIGSQIEAHITQGF